MNRSVGVTVIAVLALLGSGLTLLMGILTAVTMAVAPVPTQPGFAASPAFFKIILLVASLAYVLPAIWGILTGVGLLRLRNWARISTIVFSILLILMSGFAILTVLLIPLFPGPGGTADPSVLLVVRIFIGGFWLLQIGIGVWWLVFFNRAKVKQQFVVASVIPVPATPSPPTYAMPILPAPSTTVVRKVSQRPLSFTILAWFLLIGCLFLPFNFVLHPSVPLFTMLLTGWPAQLYLGILGLLQLYVGVGLLRLQPAARVVGVGFFGFSLVNSVVFYFSPGSRVRMLALIERQQSMFPWMSWQSQPSFQFDLTPFLVIGGCLGMVLIVVTLYFLITRKKAYENAALAAQ